MATCCLCARELSNEDPKYYACTGWTIYDLKGEYKWLTGNPISDELAQDALRSNETRIVEAMMCAGWDVIGEIIKEMVANPTRRIEITHEE